MTIEKRVTRNSDVPLYKQLYNDLKKSIENGEIKEGEPFYSEAELEKMYGVSRMTVRNAMILLENHGYISRSQGASTIVRSNKNFSWNMTELTYDLKTDKAELKSNIISITKVIPDQRLRSILRLSANDRFVYQIYRVRSIDDLKINRSLSHIVPWVGVDFTAIDFDENTSIYDVLEAVNAKPIVADDSIEAVIGPKEVCEDLELPEGSALFYRERIAYDASQRPIEYVESYYNAQYAKYYVRQQRID